MVNRGSKSRIINIIIFVKEQRVDGSCQKFNNFLLKVYSNGCRKTLSSQNPFLANTFVGFRRHLALSFVRNINTITALLPSLHPYFITGFSDGESYFSITLTKSDRMSTG
jgi:hypothetical protein